MQWFNNNTGVNNNRYALDTKCRELSATTEDQSFHSNTDDPGFESYYANTAIHMPV